MQTKEEILKILKEEAALGIVDSNTGYAILGENFANLVNRISDLYASGRIEKGWVKASDRIPTKAFNYFVRVWSTRHQYVYNDTNHFKNGWSKLPASDEFIVEWYDQFDKELRESGESSTSQPAQREEPFITIQPEEPYYAAECEYCGWIGSSGNCEGGGQIADTGDYSDPSCPCCLSERIGETDNRQPLSSYVERLSKSSEAVKQLTLLLEKCHNQLDEKNIDLLQFPKHPLPVPAQGVEEAANDFVDDLCKAPYYHSEAAHKAAHKGFLAGASYQSSKVREEAEAFEMMPFLKGDGGFPIALLSEKQAGKNHGQSLKRLKERGGLSIGEMYAVWKENIYRVYKHDEILPLMLKATYEYYQSLLKTK